MKHPTKITICLTLTLLIVSIYALAGPIPDTGQTKCYNNTEEIPCPQPGEPFYGQDGNYIINPPSYTKLDEQGNDLPDSATEWVMVRDNVTGLIWEVKTDDGSVHDRDNRYTWYDSNDETNGGDVGIARDGTDTEDFIRILNESSFGGFSYWRIPTIKELLSIADIGNRNPSINLSYFLNTMSSFYWSSTSVASNSTSAWVGGFDYGDVEHFDKSGGIYVLAVRDGQCRSFDHLIINNGDGTVTDIKTGLMWQKLTHSSKLNWEESISYCDNLKYSGYMDWRLPNREEIRSIVDYSRRNPSINVEFFDDTVSSFYWSSTSIASSSSFAWGVDFRSNGYHTTNSIKSGAYYVRAVRGGQCRIFDHLVIWMPEQGSRLNIGTKQNIMWDTKTISGNVRISISRQGGKEGSFEIIADNTENDGHYEWSVNGTESINCVLKIEPLDEPLKGNALGLFSILSPSSAKEIFSSIQHISPDTYSLSLFGLFPYGTVPIEIDWLCNDPSIIIKKNILTGTQNKWVEVNTTYNEKTYKKWLCVYKNPEHFEIESNNNKIKASPMDNEKFYRAGFYQGDIDYFLIHLSSDLIISIEYMSFSYRSDMRISVYDSNNKLMASNISSYGKAINFSLGLSQGIYYLKIESAGDVDEDNYYVVSYKAIESLLPKSKIPITINQKKQSVIHNLEDHSDYSFTLEKNASIKLLFTASTGKYHIELLEENQTVIDHINYLISNLVQNTIKLESNYPSGDYIVRVTPIDDVDATSSFTLELNESNNQLEFEPNNSYLESTDFNIEHPIMGRISTSTDTDFFTFQLDTPKFLKLNIVCNLNQNYDLIIFKESINYQIGSRQFQYSDITPFHMGLGPGRYYLKITCNESNLDYYTIIIQNSNQTNLEIEPNNNLRFANAIAMNSPKKGFIYSTGDIDYYGFYLPTRSIFSVNFTPSSETADYKFYLLDSNDQTIDLRHSPDGKACTIEAYQYPGNYYIKIENNGTVDQSNGYTLNISSEADIEGLKQAVSLIISGNKNEMQISDTKDLTVTVGYSDASSEIIANPDWKSLNEDVAIVNADGMITAIGEGNTSIVAVYSGLVARFDVLVGAPAHIVNQHHGNLILVAGGGIEASNTLKESTQYLSDMIYRRFKERLFNDEDIYYLNPMPWHDIDGDGYGDNIVDDDNPTVDDFKKAITEWAPAQSTDGPLYCYLIDHGEIDKFKIFPFQILLASDLKLFLDTFQETTNRKVVVMIEACKSGSFTDELESDVFDRVVITSTGNKNAYVDLGGHISFSQFFMDRLYSGSSMKRAFDLAKNQLSRMGLPYSRMLPQLPERMSFIADKIHIGGNFAIADQDPEILEISQDQTVSANTENTFYAKLSQEVPIEKVWAVVLPPGYTPPESTQNFEAPEVILPTFDLMDPENDYIYEGKYKDFIYNDVYMITFYARSNKGNIAVSQTIAVTVEGGQMLDTDKDGMPNDWEDLYPQLDKNVVDGASDSDGDNLSNFQEYQHNTNPMNADTDNDGMTDGWEVKWGFLPDTKDGYLDPDEDGVNNITEYQDGTNPVDRRSFKDHVLPLVLTVSPANNEKNVYSDHKIDITFNEAIKSDTINVNNFSINGSKSGSHVPKYTYNIDKHVLTILSDKPFEFAETITVTLSSNIKDTADNPLDGNFNNQTDNSPTDDYTWSFEIAKSPAIIPTNPYDLNQDWILSDFELLDAMDAWACDEMLEQMEDNCSIDFYMLNIIDLWIGRSYMYDQENSMSCFPWRQVY